jgi:hypothetical protein
MIRTLHAIKLQPPLHARSFTSDWNETLHCQLNLNRKEESLQERVRKELQTTITDSLSRDGMGRDKTVRVNSKTVCYHFEFNNHLPFSKSVRFPLQCANCKGS